MMIPVRLLSAAIATCLLARPLDAQARWNVEVFGGTAVSAPSRLVIRQRGEDEIRLRARWSTRPLDDAPYYAYRVERWSGDRGWAAEMLHHKVYLQNPPPQVRRFEVSHGYNMVTLSRLWMDGGVVLRAGGGVVLGHPESEVRGRRRDGGGGVFGTGYHLSGPAGQVAAGWRLPLAGRLFATAEAKATAAWARVPVAGGTADVPNAAVHGLAGIGWRF